MTVMKMDQPAPPNALDRGAQGLIGKPVDRIDGALKTTGQARYSYEVEQDAAYGWFATSAIGHGQATLAGLDAITAMPGVLAVIDVERLAPAVDGRTAEVCHYGQPLMLVVAEGLEDARAAAMAVRFDYVADDKGRFDLTKAHADVVPAQHYFFQYHAVRGDVDAAMADAPVTIDARYTTASHSHAPMEPHASIATWEGDSLILHGSYQMLASAQGELAQALGIDKAQIRIVSRYVGGGFGSKISLGPEAAPAAIAARVIGRPVKVALGRRQVFHATSRRSQTEQRLRLAAGRDGRLTAIGHDTIATDRAGGSFCEPGGLATVFLYAAANRHVTHDIGRLDVVESASMRAPGEAVGMLALECAMDEMAEAVGMDPVAFRLLNEPDVNPQDDRPFSVRQLKACLEEGAQRFGWNPGARREGEWLIGQGVAAAARGNLLLESAARVILAKDGRAVIETDMTDIGTGSYTILAQIAGEVLGLPIDRIEVRLGDTDLPTAAGSGGSWGAATAGSAVLLACEDILAVLAEKMGVKPEEMTLQDGMVTAGNRRVPIGELVDDAAIEAIGTIRQGSNGATYHQAGYGAHFCEVAVNGVTGEVRVRRMLGVFAAGRILNEKTATSQCIGGMIFGIGAALTEALIVDARTGHFVNGDLGEYHLPVHADVPHIDVVFLPERDEQANPLMAKGIGELGISGAGAAVANAIYNATGVRVRDYPVTLDRIIAGLPDQDSL